MTILPRNDHFHNSVSYAAKTGKKKHAAYAALNRSRAEGKLYSPVPGIYVSLPNLPPVFVAREFAEYFGLSLPAAKKALKVHVAHGELSTHEAGYVASPEQLEVLIRAYSGLLAGNNKWLELGPRLMDLKWPLTPRQFADALEVGYHMARKDLADLYHLGLLDRSAEGHTFCYSPAQGADFYTLYGLNSSLVERVLKAREQPNA